MNLSSETSGAIEAGLDEFEGQWLRGPTPPDVVRTVEALQRHPGAEAQRLAWEVAMSDLELRWRHHDPAMRRGSRWYAERLARHGFSAVDFEELSAHELVVRSRWGDRPAIDALLDEQFPGIGGDARQQHRQRLLTQLELHFPVSCIVKVDGGSRFRAEIPTPCVVGRQRIHDPAPGTPYLDAETDQWRMVVVDRQQNRVSRSQAVIRRVAVHQVSIESISPNVGCYLDQQRLPLEQPVVVEITARPRELRFQNVALRLFPG
ncbi:hypothetical protein [Candidatus Laterigemmans baculatus]|uniref:hypothetical protein n=1 Tax=Candidatus Laterigemmans baculatus TaxID=2770505 RepID=UPI0013D8E9C8|nr:hypothetical protein [Candidatus Laterigemmans baculatus]